MVVMHYNKAQAQLFILNWWIDRVPAGYGWGKGGRCCLCQVAGNSV